jgi:peptidoglycan/xylan/chitin deacetylase (PgdA/CDA1 family)
MRDRVEFRFRHKIIRRDITPTHTSADSLDWKDLSAEDITKRVTSKAAPGSIVLFHNAAKHTPEALPGIIEFLIREGYAIMPVSELLLPGAYTIDHSGRMKK